MKREVEQTGTTADTIRSVAEAVETFWETRTGAMKKDKTFEHDRWMLDMVTEGLGQKRVSTLSVKDCDDFLKQVAEGLLRPDGSKRKPLVREHVSRTRSMLIRVLNNEVRLGFQARNVAELAAMPETKKISRTHRILSPSELGQLLERSSGAVAVFIDLCGKNGLRPQEARALEWSAFDPNEHTLDVGPQMNRKGVIVGPKTKRAPRTIALAPTTVGMLTAWRDQQTKLRVRAGELWVSKYDLIISTSIGTEIQGGNIGRSLKKLSTDVGIKPTIIAYDLRHTAITLQSKLGYSDWELADWAGTSERMINEVYRHRTDRVAKVRPLDL